MIKSLHALVFAATLALLPAWAQAQDAGGGSPPGIPADTEIKTTASGLKYSVLKQGTGTVSPSMGDPVKVHYTGWLTNGKQFDSSRKTGRPASFRVGQLISGWNEALQLMVAGDRWKLTIPAELGYGAQGSQGIPGGSTLIFDVELVEVTALPQYVPLDPEKTKTTESGLSYQIVRAGEGESPTATDGVELRHALWSTDGQLKDCTETGRTGAPMQMTCEKPPLAFFKEAVQLMRPGAVYRFSVPKSLTGDNPMLKQLPGDATIWEFEVKRVVKPLPVPTFSIPEDSELETTRSGLRYQVIREGEGVSPKMGEDVTCHYAGWLTDGTLFDASYSRGFETTFQLGRVIPGWNEGLQLMKPGAIYKFVIPPQLAYGSRQMGPTIKPNSTLVFQVELVRNGK